MTGTSASGNLAVPRSRTLAEIAFGDSASIPRALTAAPGGLPLLAATARAGEHRAVLREPIRGALDTAPDTAPNCAGAATILTAPRPFGRHLVKRSHHLFHDGTRDDSKV